MRLLVAIVLAGAAASAAHAEPAFGVFKTFCADTHAERGSALAAAGKAGWTPIPQAMLGSLNTSGGFSEMDGRMTSTSEGLEIMFVARAQSIAPGHPAQANICAVAVAPGDLAAVKQEAAAFAGVEADPDLVKDATATAFAWREVNGRHERVRAAGLSTGALDPSTSVLATGTAGPAVIIALAVPPK